MKKIVSSALALLLVIGSVSAQDVKQKGEGHHRKEQRKENYKDVNLSADQKAQMEVLKNNFKKEMADLKSNSSLSESEKKEKRNAIGKEFRSKANAILSPDQRNEVAKMREERKKEGRHTEFKKGNKKSTASGRGDKAKQMEQKLNLTAAQQQKVSSIKENYKPKFAAIRSNESLTDESKKDKMKTLRMARQQEIKAVLTPEQIEKLKNGRKEHSNKNTK